MGIRIRTGIGPVRVSIPLTPRRSRRRRTLYRYRTTTRRPAPAPRRPGVFRRIGPIGWAVILFMSALGSTDYPADMLLFLLASGGLGWWGWRRRQ